MCGLVGMFVSNQVGFLGADRDELKDMMVLNSLRGVHSTGISGISLKNQNPKPHVVKSVGSPYSLFSYNGTTEFMTKMVVQHTAIIAHGRFATKGDVNALNAHPFKSSDGNIILAHNGVIRNYFTLKGTNYKHCEVDSHLICELIAEQGAEKILPKIDGAFVFMWFNVADKTFNIARNSERPLFVSKLKNRDVLYFASEEETLSWNSSRNNTPMEDPEEVQPMFIHTWSHGNLTPKSTPFEKEKVHYNTEKKPTTKMITQIFRGTSVSNLVTGQRVSIDLVDIVEYKHYNLIIGKSPLYPDVEFNSTVVEKALSDDLLNSGVYTATVSNISPNYNPVESQWLVRVTDLKPSETTVSIEQDEARYEMYDSTGMSQSIAKHRLSEIVDKGCLWCFKRVSQKQKKRPDRMLLHTGVDGALGVVCPACSAHLISSFKVTN